MMIAQEIRTALVTLLVPGGLEVIPLFFEIDGALSRADRRRTP